MAINKTRKETKEAIKRKSAFSLPTRPTEAGFKAADIKKAFYAPLLDDDNSFMAELDRIVDEINSGAFEGGGVGNVSAGIDRIDKTSTDGLVDTYTIYLKNGDTESFTVTNGRDGTSGLFVGTREEYELADKAGQVAVGTVVVITDEGDEITSSILGEAILGQMILG